MSKVKNSAISNTHTSVHKRTSQGGKVKTSSMNKTARKSHKRYRGQGR
jgi:hypothetical protein